MKKYNIYGGRFKNNSNELRKAIYNTLIHMGFSVTQARQWRQFTGKTLLKRIKI